MSEVAPAPARLTRADITGRKAINVAHIDMAGGAAWMCDVEGIPRLSIWDQITRGQKIRVWRVDGKPVRDLAAALAVLNGDIPLEEAIMHDAPAPPKKKYSLDSQIAEVERELKMREEVYPRMVKNRQMKEGEAELKIGVMKSVLVTLQWLRENEATIKQRLSY